MNIMAQSVGAAEYIDCISAEGEDCPNECPRYDYDTKTSDVVMRDLWGNAEYPFIAIAPRSNRI